jgi:hypothetical protein
MGLLASVAGSHNFDVTAAILFARLVEAAYTMHAAEPTSSTPTPQGLPTGFRFGAWITMRDFVLAPTGPEFYGLIAHSTTDPMESVLAIRGTVGGIEWWDDVNAVALQPFKVPNSGLVGAGFAKIYDTLQVIEPPASGATAQPLMAAGSFSQQVAEHVRRQAAVAPQSAAPTSPAEIYVTGHSLGAALATLYVLDNTVNGHVRNPSLYTFASPQVGNLDFVRRFNQLNLVSWRVVNTSDLVPMLPPEGFGFRHVEQEKPFISIGKVRPDVGCWHALSTYLALLDKNEPIDPGCLPQASTNPTRPEGPPDAPLV